MQIHNFISKHSQVEMSELQKQQKEYRYGELYTNTKKNLYIVVLYYQIISGSIERSTKMFGLHMHFKGRLTMINLLMASKDKDHIVKKVESYISTLLIGWSAMNSILGNEHGHMLKGSGNINKLTFLYMIIPPDHVMKSILITSI